MRPFANVDVAVELVVLRADAESPPVNVEVEFAPVTLRNPCMVDVPMASPCSTENVVVPTESMFVEKMPAAVDEPDDTKPPAEFTENTLPPAEFVKRMKSPVAPCVEDAWMRTDAVDVPAMASMALGASV